MLHDAAPELDDAQAVAKLPDVAQGFDEHLRLADRFLDQSGSPSRLRSRSRRCAGVGIPSRAVNSVRTVAGLPPADSARAAAGPARRKRTVLGGFIEFEYRHRVPAGQ